MKMLSCKAMGDPTCDFVAKGETDEEVMAQMAAHAKEHHADNVSGKTDEELNAMMMPKIETV